MRLSPTWIIQYLFASYLCWWLHKLYKRFPPGFPRWPRVFRNIRTKGRIECASHLIWTARTLDWMGERENRESTLWMLVWDCGVQCTYKHTRQSPAIRFFMIRPVDLGPPLKVKHQIPLLFSFCSSFFEAVDSFLQQEDSQGKFCGEEISRYIWRQRTRALHYVLSAYFLFAERLIGVHCTHGINRTGFLICKSGPNRFFLSPVLLLFWFFCRRYMISKLGFSPGEAAKGKFSSLNFLSLKIGLSNLGNH